MPACLLSYCQAALSAFFLSYSVNACLGLFRKKTVPISFWYALFFFFLNLIYFKIEIRCFLQFPHSFTLAYLSKHCTPHGTITSETVFLLLLVPVSVSAHPVSYWTWCWRKRLIHFFFTQGMSDSLSDDPTHIINLAIKRLHTDNDDSLADLLQSFCQKREEALASRGIRRVTFVVNNSRAIPKYFTYR